VRGCLLCVSAILRNLLACANAGAAREPQRFLKNMKTRIGFYKIKTKNFSGKARVTTNLIKPKYSLFIICYAEIARRNEPASRISKKIIN
jgi:hypothetical protein